MATYEIVVTDVTCYGSLYCVAGWDLHAQRMLRPEPPGSNMVYEASKFWDARFAGPGRFFSVGNVVSFEAALAPADFLFPHATEDRIVDTARPMSVLRMLDLPGTTAAAAAGLSPTLEAAFDGALVRANSGKAYVRSGHRGRSLGAIDIAAGRIVFLKTLIKATSRSCAPD